MFLQILSSLPVAAHSLTRPPPPPVPVPQHSRHDHPKQEIEGEEVMLPHRTRPMTALLVFMGVNLVLVSTISPLYDFVCFHPYWERRREHRRKQREAAMEKGLETS